MNSHSTAKPKQDSLIGFVFSGVASFVASVVDYPFNMMVGRVVGYEGRIRTIEQFKQAAFAESYNKGTYEEGVSLFRGFWVGQAQKTGHRTFKFWFQPILVNKLAYLTRLDEENEPKKKVIVEGIAGGLTKLFQHFMFYPFKTIKVKRQNGNKDPLLYIVKNDKFNLYNAHELELLNKMASAFVLFSATAAILRMLGVRNEKDASFWQFATASNIATAFSVLTCYPMSVVQERLQLETTMRVSSVGMFKRIVQHEGARALYKGASASLITSFPTKALPLALTNWMMSIWTMDRQAVQVQHHPQHRRPEL